MAEEFNLDSATIISRAARKITKEESELVVGKLWKAINSIVDKSGIPVDVKVDNTERLQELESFKPRGCMLFFFGEKDGSCRQVGRVSIRDYSSVSEIAEKETENSIIRLLKRSFEEGTFK